MTESACHELIDRIQPELPKGMFALCGESLVDMLRGSRNGWSVSICTKGPKTLRGNITSYRQFRAWWRTAEGTESC